MRTIGNGGFLRLKADDLDIAEGGGPIPKQANDISAEEYELVPEGFGSVCDLEPDSIAVSLRVTVVSVKTDKGKSGSPNEAIVGELSLDEAYARMSDDITKALAEKSRQ